MNTSFRSPISTAPRLPAPRFRGNEAEGAKDAQEAKEPELPELTRAKALELIAEGKILLFNDQKEAWRKNHPGQYFDLKGANFSTIIKENSLEAQEDALLDFRGVDLRNADFRGLKSIEAMMSADDDYGSDLPKDIDPVQGVRFSPSTVKNLT